jgi:hypothetical protein
MAGSQIIKGTGRRTLFSGISTTGIVNSVGLGVYNVAGFCRFAGLFTVTGSVNFQWRMGVSSGSWSATSSTVINSGGFILDNLIFGNYAEFSFTAANSQTPTYMVAGEAIR